MSFMAYTRLISRPNTKATSMQKQMCPAEEMEAAGGFSYYTNYSAGVVNTTTSETYLECYQKCKDFNGESPQLPSLHANECPKIN
jgi:hypothetical protein